MAEIGVNIDPNHWGFDPLIQELDDLGVHWVRFVIKEISLFYTTLCERLFTSGFRMLAVLDRDSLGEDRSKWRAKIRDYGVVYSSFVDLWQVGNEPDGRDASSWKMPRSDAIWLHTAAREELGLSSVVGPGLVSGDSSYAFAQRCGVHPYGRWPTTAPVLSRQGEQWGFGPVDALVNQYADAFGTEPGLYRRRIIVSEFGAPRYELYDHPGYIGGMTRTLSNNPDVGLAFLFKLENEGVDGFGIVSAATGYRYPAWEEFRLAVRANDHPDPEPTPEPEPEPELPPDPGTQPNFEIGAGFRAAVVANGWTPLGPECYFPSDQVHYSFLLCREGTLWWSKATNEIVGIPK